MIRRERILFFRKAWESRDYVGMAKTAAATLNFGSRPPILPASGNEQGLWHVLWKNHEITGACLILQPVIFICVTWWKLAYDPHNRRQHQLAGAISCTLRNPGHWFLKPWARRRAVVWTAFTEHNCMLYTFVNVHIHTWPHPSPVK